MKRIEANIINSYGSDGFIIKPNIDGHISSILIKKICHAAEITMAELVRRRNELHPTAQTTPQNLSNKLYRDTLKLSEFIELVNCAGFNLVFEEIQKDNTLRDLQGNPLKSQAETISDSQPHRKDEPPIIRAQKTFDELLEEDFTEVSTINFDAAIVAGKNCNEAAEWIKKQLSNDISQSQELLIYARATKKYGVKIRPIGENT